MKDPEALLADNDLEGSLKALQQKIRSKPSDSALRVFLFQLYAVQGYWDKALTQLNVVGQLDDSALAMVVMYRQMLSCEAYREDVFNGSKAPVLFGAPADWSALLLQALTYDLKGQPSDAASCREAAIEAMPATSGLINGEAFEWLMDGDFRFGPILEVVLEGRYLWVPFNAISQIDIEEPQDLRDLIWTPAHFIWSHGGESFGVIPTRYPGSEKQGDALFSLAKKTAWTERSRHSYEGIGQRVFISNQAEYSLMDIRNIQFDSSDEGATDG